MNLNFEFSYTEHPERDLGIEKKPYEFLQNNYIKTW